MSWTDIFRSRYVRFLEAELNSARKNHADELDALKKIHAEERERCILETNRAWGEADRLRQYLLPGMPVADRNPQSTEESKPAVESVPHGTPFQRLQYEWDKKQAEIEQAEAAAKKEKQDSAAPS